ncbi:MAG: type II toxin-antitoxin system PemK/MazF family toxin [Cyclobacteriaceae bacterium]
MRQGEIWNANLNPSKGSEQAGFRPVVIISGNLLNEFLNVVIVIPLTTKIKKYKGNPVLSPNKMNGLKKDSEMLVFHIRSISKDRLVEKRGAITVAEVELTVKTINDLLKY